jgi:outer membrane receptor protein involved in Fe transport
MKKNVFTLLFCAFLTPLFAAYNLTGRIVDSNTVQPLDFVNVALFWQGSDAMISGVITDENGRFEFQRVAAGNYTLQVSFIGYNAYSRNFTVTDRDVYLGTIRLTEDSQMLGEVEVIGMGSQMRFEVDRRVFSVDQNIAAAGGSITEVLENIPSVEVDQEGNISLRNNESVEVWINGRPSGLTAENRAQILQQMPAESIESIEIITNPSARFDSEGTAGIINLVMKKDRRAGYFGNVSSGLTYVDGGRFGNGGRLGGNFGANINYNSSRFDAHANIGYRNMARQGGARTELKNWNQFNTDTTFLIQNTTNSSNWESLFFRAGIDYHINRRNTIGISGFGSTGGNNGESHINNLQRNLTSGDTLRHFSRNNTNEFNRNNFNIRLDYKHEFDKPGTDLQVNVSYSRHNLELNNIYLQTDFFPSERNSEIRQRGGGNDDRLQFRMDYTNRLTETGRLEAGVQSTIASRFGDTQGFNVASNIESELFGYYNEFDYKEQIHAAYVTYGERFFNKLSAQLGLRGEYIWRDMESKDKNAAGSIQDVSFNFTPDYFELFPSLFLGYSITERDDVQLNYTRRISRPRGQQINPFRDFSDSLNVSFGNPALHPEFSSAFELNYLRTWDNHSLSASAYYRFTDNVVQRISYRNPAGNNMESTFMNISQSQSSGVELVSRNRLFQMLNLTSSLNVFYHKIDSAIYINPLDTDVVETIAGRENLSWNTRVMANLMFSRTFTGQITAQYRSPRQIAQGTQEGEYSIDLGLRKSFFNRSLNVSANVRDLLNSRGRISTTEGDGFWRHSDSQWHGRSIGVTASYNFGNMQPNRRNQNRDRNGDNDMDDMDMMD